MIMYRRTCIRRIGARRKAIEFIQRNREQDKPWFLSINPFDPHPPFDAPHEYYRRYHPDALPGAHFAETATSSISGGLEAAEYRFSKCARATPADVQHKHIQASYYAMIEFLDEEFGRLVRFPG